VANLDYVQLVDRAAGAQGRTARSETMLEICRALGIAVGRE
jgi:hypothetical protein